MSPRVTRTALPGQGSGADAGQGQIAGPRHPDRTADQACPTVARSPVVLPGRALGTVPMNGARTGQQTHDRRQICAQPSREGGGYVKAPNQQGAVIGGLEGLIGRTERRPEPRHPDGLTRQRHPS